MRAAVLPVPGRRFVKVTEFIPMAVAARRIGIDPYFTVDVVLCGQYDTNGLLLDTSFPWHSRPQPTRMDLDIYASTFLTMTYDHPR